MSAPITEPTKVDGAGVPPQRTVKKAPPRPGDKRTEGMALNVFSHGFLALWAILIILPLLWLVLSSFKTDAQIGGRPSAGRPTGSWTCSAGPGTRASATTSPTP